MTMWQFSSLAKPCFCSHQTDGQTSQRWPTGRATCTETGRVSLASMDSTSLWHHQRRHASAATADGGYCGSKASYGMRCWSPLSPSGIVTHGYATATDTPVAMRVCHMTHSLVVLTCSHVLATRSHVTLVSCGFAVTCDHVSMGITFQVSSLGHPAHPCLCTKTELTCCSFCISSC
ncbi:hypothetical protein NP493_364g03052 [Ridgeia piscesae]|uniref:Uncharacterized protein n=1 Tax=Ridgeia piscesae TaxID=27915 RepID=A0AAD9NW20_RIDPI|nr:hypothetical protein NP493_364g03052 [Ridgeia piscesae]